MNETAGLDGVQCGGGNVTQGGGRVWGNADFQAEYQGTSEVEQELERVPEAVRYPPPRKSCPSR